MNTLVIGCRTTEKELTAAMNVCGISYEISWIEAGLHNVKKKLNHSLQEIIDNSHGCEQILFSTGFCGNSILGLTARQAALIIPRVDDCISLLLGGCQKKLVWKDSYFLTEGWLKGETNIWREYQHSMEKYGEKRAKRIFQKMLAHYRNITLLDTGCYDLSGALLQARQIAEAFSLECQILQADTDYIRTLLTGPWDPKRFLIVSPGQQITDIDLVLT